MATGHMASSCVHPYLLNKHASELTLSEAAVLVGLPNAPSLYDPFTKPDSCVSRRNLVLSRMLEAGDISQEEYDAACGRASSS